MAIESISWGIGVAVIEEMIVGEKKSNLRDMGSLFVVREAFHRDIRKDVTKSKICESMDLR